MFSLLYNILSTAFIIGWKSSVSLWHCTRRQCKR